MIEPDQQYLFASARVPNAIADVLANFQRDVAQSLKEKEYRHKLLPRRMFLVPLFNFRKVPRLSDEAIVLAVERIRESIEPVKLTVRKVESWPSAEQVEQIVARLDDDNEAFRTLRTRLVDALGALGFEVDADDWSPIVPLIRVSTVEEAPAFELDIEVDTEMSWSVSEVELPETNERATYSLSGKKPSEINEQSFDSATLSPLKRHRCGRNCIDARNRIAELRLRLSESRRSERAKNLRVERYMEPQHPDKADD